MFNTPMKPVYVSMISAKFITKIIGSFVDHGTEGI
jgi:hypothetical protein